MLDDLDDLLVLGHSRTHHYVPRHVFCVWLGTLSVLRLHPNLPLVLISCVHWADRPRKGGEGESAARMSF